jgi:hypothetical protein
VPALEVEALCCHGRRIGVGEEGRGSDSDLCRRPSAVVLWPCAGVIGKDAHGGAFVFCTERMCGPRAVGAEA